MRDYKFVWEMIAEGELENLKQVCPRDFNWRDVDPIFNHTPFQRMILPAILNMLAKTVPEEKYKDMISWMVERGADPLDVSPQNALHATFFKADIKFKGCCAFTTLMYLKKELKDKQMERLYKEAGKALEGLYYKPKENIVNQLVVEYDTTHDKISSDVVTIIDKMVLWMGQAKHRLERNSTDLILVSTIDYGSSLWNYMHHTKESLAFQIIAEDLQYIAVLTIYSIIRTLLIL